MRNIIHGLSGDRDRWRANERQKTATSRIPGGREEGGGLKSVARKSRVTGDACLENIHPRRVRWSRDQTHRVSPASFFLPFSIESCSRTATCRTPGHIRHGQVRVWPLHGRAIQNFQVILNTCQTAAAKRDEEG